jgi:chromosome segregation ATPase
MWSLFQSLQSADISVQSDYDTDSVKLYFLFLYFCKGHHTLLKQHLQKATAEKAWLEENAAELGERAEKLKYELAEAREAARSRDEVIALLEDQVNHLETMYTKSLEESHKYKLRLGNLEQELKHLKEVCCKVS